MRNYLSLSTASLIALSAAGALVAQDAMAQSVARSGEVSGRVVSKKKGEEGRLVPAREYRDVAVKQRLKEGDVLRTNRVGTLAILFVDRTQIRLGRNSTLVVDGVRRGAASSATLSKGKAWGRSPRKKSNLRVRTPSATAAIRGTEWYIESDENSTLLEVFEGEVVLENEFGSVTVGAGEAARADLGQAPVKVPISSSDGRSRSQQYVTEADARAIMAGRTSAVAIFDRRLAALENEGVVPPMLADETADGYLGKGAAAAYEGDLDRAAAIVDEGRSRHPGDSALEQLDAAIERLRPGTPVTAAGCGIAPRPQEASDAWMRARNLLAAGDRAAATEAAREASAMDPYNAAGLTALAELEYGEGNVDVAQQQLDVLASVGGPGAGAAARTAIALHQWDADGAITAAQAASDDPCASETLASNLAEGSVVSQAYRFSGLTGWARFSGDRAFDPFSGAGYRDQIANRKDSPIPGRGPAGEFASYNADEADDISAFLQGSARDPLAIVDTERDLLISRAAVFEGALGGGLFLGDDAEGTQFSFDASGLASGAVPFAFDVSLQTVDRTFEDALAINGIPGVPVSDSFDRTRFDGRFGVELGTGVSISSIFQFTKDGFDSLDVGAGEAASEADRTLGAIVFNYALGPRSHLTFGGMVLRGDSRLELENDLPDFELVSLAESREVDLFSVGWSGGFGPLVVRTGVEYNRDERSESYSLVADTLQNGFFNEALCSDPNFFPVCFALGFDQGAALFFQNSAFSQRRETVRPYVDFLADLDQVEVQAQLAYVSQDTEDRTAAVPTTSEEFFDFKLGFGIAPVQGQWLRVAVDRSAAANGYTFAPIATLGLLPFRAWQDGRSTAYTARWDAQWSDRIFTAVHYQREDIAGLGFVGPDLFERVEGDEARIERLCAELDLMLGGGLGVHVGYSFIDSEARSEFFATPITDPLGGGQFLAGSALPYVPSDRGNIALTWTNTAPLRLQLRAVLDYTGDQLGGDAVPIDGYVTASIGGSLELLDRQLVLEVDIENLLDERPTFGTTSLPGRVARIGAKFRF